MRYFKLFILILIKPFLWAGNAVHGFFSRLFAATDGKRVLVLWMCVFFFSMMSLGSAGKDEFLKYYGIGYEGGKFASNDIYFFFIKRHATDLTDLKRGEYVAFKSNLLMPYLGPDQQVIKHIGAIPGDLIDIKEGVLFINNVKAGVLNPHTLQVLKHPASFYNRHFIVPKNTLFVLGTNPRSYDSRFWGVLPINPQVKVDRAYPIF